MLQIRIFTCVFFPTFCGKNVGFPFGVVTKGFVSFWNQHCYCTLCCNKYLWNLPLIPNLIHLLLLNVLKNINIFEIMQIILTPICPIFVHQFFKSAKPAIVHAFHIVILCQILSTYLVLLRGIIKMLCELWFCVCYLLHLMCKNKSQCKYFVHLFYLLVMPKIIHCFHVKIKICKPKQKKNINYRTNS